MQDLGDSILVTTQATLDAVCGDARPPARPAPLPHQRARRARRRRAYAEEDWEGRRLRIGEVELQLLHPCERCVIPTRDPDTTVKDAEILRWLTREHGGLFGINARPRGDARIAVGDQVELL